MSKNKFIQTLKAEVDRIDNAYTSKRHEKIIQGYTSDQSPKAIINHLPYHIFNSNDYLGLRFDERLIKAEHEASMQYGTSPGAVRFISGTCKIYLELEQKLAQFHKREAAMITSSAFAANVGVIHALIKGQSKDSLLFNEVLVLSDALNHRSIIDGIRIANLPANQRITYGHLNTQEVSDHLEQNKHTFQRAVVITDGIFSMLGESAPLAKLHEIVRHYDQLYQQGVLLVVDDSHGVAAYGPSGRGTEDQEGTLADVLIATLGKGFGSDGGYVVADNQIIDYLRESTATYIYSNPVSPGVAASGAAAVDIVAGAQGEQLLIKLYNNLHYFKQKMAEAGFQFAAESDHPIQPILIGDTEKTKQLVSRLYDRQILVTNISYPIVQKGKDEIRVQVNALHQKQDIDYFVSAFTQASDL